MNFKIGRVSLATLIALCLSVGNVAAINGVDEGYNSDTDSNNEGMVENNTEKTPSLSSETELNQGSGQGTESNENDNQKIESNESNNQEDEIKQNNVENTIKEEKKREVVGQTNFVDENGNITTIDVYDGTTGETHNPRTRVVTTANMVNFNYNCKEEGETTKFTNYYTGQDVYISKTSGADAAFLGYENGKVKFMVSGIVGLVDSSEVEVLTQGRYYASNYEVNSAGNLYHYISTNVNATGNEGTSNYIGKGPSYLTKKKEYYSYDGHYFYSDYNVMINDYKNNSRANSVNPNNPYYSYFQYLPLRSKTNYTGAQLTAYLNSKANSSTSKLNNTGDIFIKYQNKYGVNALLAASFAALESGWGKSDIAQNKNNIFGLNATDANPGEDAKLYSSVDSCIYDFSANWMSMKYLNGIYTGLFRGGYFGDKGSGIFGKYSSDPYEGEKCASIALNMDAKIAGKDKDYYTIGLKDAKLTSFTSLPVKQSTNANATTLYNTIKNPAYAFIIRKKAPNNGYYEVQSDSVLNANRNGVSSSAEYDFYNHYGFVKSDQLTIINSGNDATYNPPVISNAKITNITKTGYTVTCTVTDDGLVDRVLMPTWSENNGQDDLVWYTASKSGNTYTINVKTSNHKNDTGKFNTHIYAYDNEGNESKVELSATLSGSNVAPAITNAKITNLSHTGYTVTCTVTDDKAVDRVLMPTWSENNGQDDLVWYTASKSGNTYTINVKTSAHKNDSGKFNTHIYAYDNEGKESIVKLETVVPKLNTAPVISNAKVTNVSKSGYTVTCTITDDKAVDRVLMPTWSENNGQDDLVWYTANKSGNTYTINVKTSNHKNDSGKFNTHIYAYDNEGRESKIELSATVPGNTAPTISNAKVTNVSRSGYTVTCTVTDDNGVNRVLMPTWSENNGQDDLVWYTANKSGNTYTINVKTSNHKNDSGKFNTHIYAYDSEGKENKIELFATVPGNIAPSITNAKVTNVSRGGYTVTCTVTDDNIVDRVLMPTWSDNKGQDDLVWYTANKSGNTYTINVRISNHKNDSGKFNTHIYAYDNEGKESKVELSAIVPGNAAPVISNAKVTNVSKSGYTVTCTVTDDNLVNRVMMPTWSENNGQDDLVWYTASKSGNTYTINVKISNHKNDNGKFNTHIYAYDNEGKESKVELSTTIPDNDPPAISNAKITNVSRAGYTVTCTVTDDSAVDRVLMPTWSDNKGQDDLVWYTASKNGSTYTIEVKASNHNYDTGKFNTHIYAYDTKGKESKIELSTTIPRNTASVISDIKVGETSSDGYTITCKVSDDLEVVRVLMPTWTINGSQDDIVWHAAKIKDGVATVHIDRSNHNFEYGDYITHIYAYDNEGLQSSPSEARASIIEPDVKTYGKPIIKNVKITDANDAGYTIRCNVVSNVAIERVSFPTWTYKNDQDDLVWGDGTKEGNEYVFRIKRSDHNYEFGRYITHIYAYDVNGKENKIVLPNYNILNTTERKGWAYIDGQKYFFDNKGNIAGNMPSKKVIDVSSYNGDIDWDTVKNYGEVDGAILRITAHPKGSYIEDTKFADNLANCRRLGIPFGVYIYDYANNTSDAVNEAELVVKILKKYNVTPSELRYPVFYDLEREVLSTQQNVDNVNAFMQVMNRYGYNAKVYSYRSLLQGLLKHPTILSQTAWLAAYTNTMGWESEYYHGEFGWQYTSGGIVPGVTGYVDISCWFTI